MNNNFFYRKPYNKQLNVFTLFFVVLMLLVKKSISFFYGIDLPDKFPVDPLLDIILLSCIVGYASNIAGATTSKKKGVSMLLILFLFVFYCIAIVEPISRGISWAKEYVEKGCCRPN